MKKVEFLLDNEKSIELLDNSDLDLVEYSTSMYDIFNSDVLCQLTNTQHTQSLIIRPSSIIAIKVQEIQEKNINDIATDE